MMQMVGVVERSSDQGKKGKKSFNVTMLRASSRPLNSYGGISQRYISDFAVAPRLAAGLALQKQEKAALGFTKLTTCRISEMCLDKKGSK